MQKGAKLHPTILPIYRIQFLFDNSMDITVALKIADLLLKITTSPIAKEIKSICKYEDEIKRFANTVAMVGGVLSSVEDKPLFQDQTVQRLREAYLDAMNFLDAVETYRKKHEAVTTRFNEEKEEMDKASGKRKQLVARARIKKKAILMKTRRFLSGPNPVKMHNAKKEIAKNLNQIEKDMKMFEQIKYITPAATNHAEYRATGPCSVDADKVIGREEDKRKIVGLLTTSAADPKKIPVISIVGMGGLGKTTTAQLVYDDKDWQKSCRFDLKFWVSDSKQFDVESLLKNILKSISREDTTVDTLERSHLEEQLGERICGKRFFCVLDDVENEDFVIWEKLESLFNRGNRAESRILVTTRAINVAKVMGSDSPYELKCLSETNALQLFERYAFRGGRDEKLVEIAKLVGQKCHGVPLVIQVIGSLLCNKEKLEWERVLGDISSAINDDSNPIIPILMISYYNLDSTLKRCFSYCALFPKNHKISKQILSSIWRANIQLKNGTDLPEDDCEKNLKTLCDRRLIEKATDWSGDICYKMHDLLHELANKVAGKENGVISNAKVVSNKLINEQYARHVSLTQGAIKDGKFSSFEVQGKRLSTFLHIGKGWSVKFRVDTLVLDCPVIRLLYIHSWRIKNLKNSIGKLIHLRYLDLSNNDFQTLPNSIVELINLRHLSLAECMNLKKLPKRIKKLTNLGVLDISNCYRLKELPMGIVKLIKLKHLRLEGCRGLTQWPTGMGALKSLCTIEKFIVGDPKSNCSAQLEELGRLSESIGGKLEIQLPNNTILKESFDEEGFLLKKKNLRQLQITWRDNPEDEVPSNHIDVLAKLQPPPNLEEFHLDGYQGMAFPPWILEEFHLEGYQGMAFPPWIPSECFASVLPNLSKLYISNCGKCQHLPPLGRLPCLKYLELCGLRNLEYIEENVPAALFCPSLEILKLHDLPNLKGWCRGAATGSDDDGEHQQFLMLPSFPCLNKLHIRSCPRLTVAPRLLSFVKVYSVNRNAKRFKERLSALSSSSVNLFVQVCRNGGEFSLSCYKGYLMLDISDRDASGNQSINMAEPFREMSKHLWNLKISNFSGLKTLPGLQHLTALVHLEIKKCCDFTGERDVQVSWKELRSLNSLTLMELPKMEKLPEGIQFLPSIKSLKCENCCEFTEEIDGQVSWKHFQRLESLTLHYLPKMKRLPEGIQLLTSLQELSIRSCKNLLLPEWLKETFNTRTNKEGYYTFKWDMDSNNVRVPAPEQIPLRI